MIYPCIEFVHITDGTAVLYGISFSIFFLLILLLIPGEMAAAAAAATTTSDGIYFDFFLLLDLAERSSRTVFSAVEPVKVYFLKSLRAAGHHHHCKQLTTMYPGGALPSSQLKQ